VTVINLKITLTVFTAVLQRCVWNCCIKLNSTQHATQVATKGKKLQKL